MAVVREDVARVSVKVDNLSALNDLNDALDETKKMANGLGGDAFDEMIKESKKAKAGVEGVAEGGEDAHAQLKKIANTSFDKTIGGLKTMASTLGKVGVATGKVLAKGIAAGAAGVGALVTKSVMGFADYEQLVGGVDTLFKDMSGSVQKNADKAYKTAGLSQNEYMETVTSFSASLIQSLGGDTAEAVRLSDMAIIDMSDNANKMGSDMGSIQDAYQGFAKKNYTMLDNLKLGYGGTQEEMKRLLADAQKLSGQKFDISSYADVVEAIHVIQENMGIAGTTAKEASETISGSWKSMKSSWSNTLTALILGGEDFDRCVDNLVDSAKTFGKNIMPAIVSALEGVGELIGELAPLIEKELPGLVKTLLPPLLKAATSLVKGLIVALPDIVKTIAGELPTIMSELWGAIKEAFGDVPGLDKAETFFKTIKTWFTENSETIKALIPAVVGLVGAFKLLNKIHTISGLFGGSKGGTGGGFFGNLAKMKTGNVLKGLGNLAIIVGGLAGLAAVLMWAAPYMAQLSDWKSTTEVLICITAVGIIGTGMTQLAASVGNIPVATVAKGLANIAIVMVGFGALAAVLMWVARYMEQLADLGTTMKILLVIGVTGLVGTALAGLAGIIGAFPVTTVLTGLANIALALGGFTAIVEAFGLLSEIPGFTEFMNKGGEVLSNLCNILGDMVGSLIGGIGEGLTDSLPKIGENLTAFAESLQPMFKTFSGVDTEGLSNFAGSLAALIGVLAGEQITSIFTGGIDYAGLGTDLSNMATNMSGFFTAVMALPEGGFDKAKALFDCLAGIKSLPEEGGVVGWFNGEVDFSKLATGMTQLAGAAGAFTTIKSIPEEAFTKISSLFECLAGIKALPQDGGIVGWFMGEVSFSKIATGIQQLASAGLITALNTLSALPENAFTSLTSLFDALAGIKSLPSEGGLFDWFTGDATTTLTNVAAALPGVASNIASFFTNLGGITDFTPIGDLFDELNDVEIDTDALDKGFLGLGETKMAELGSALSSFATNAKSFFSAIKNVDGANVDKFFDGLKAADGLPESLSTLDGSVGTALSNLVTTAQTKLGELKTAFSNELGAIIVLMNTTANTMYSSGVAIMQGVNNGMNSMRGRLIATARSMAAAIQSAFDVRLDINSPSRETFKSGVFVGEGYDLGMQSKIPDLQATASRLGSASIPYASRYSPTTDGGTVYNSRSSSEYTTISPTFNLTVSGTADDRAMARKVKRWVNESIQDVFESMERKTYVAREA